ncbi:DUF6391 domain-containing protein [Umezakia ovalisporum]|uniref:DUF6391 domain-containing protein n=2 Tax=Umezakia ovalisporum TaxID=75695 RepID=A0AA43GX61_9CYAN|nr:DUF6391 domain-containing protein [Umezakia ovalisporum]MDH6058659.1 DUF6391 domain-containing protein [Umezakia ovalisporum FSS-43]MDH6063100.1 DUF6391 domain-containing protein [Umezakia ovalisporum FSS-62]MDH6066827.1 DUF6391 domain-containing protein [Umezakia ovalisporum APH033B]MDH6071616.1 DUF6391 domain-containing protein [Umezakia ovalisporum CobakiLakeA]MDH6073022.1 DUF6391 domain-containing protein [Umezakia ovalisporum CS-1034]
MNSSAFVPGGSSTFDFFNFDFTAPQPTGDADLLKQLSFIPGLKEMILLRQVHALEHATVWVLSETNNAYAPRGRGSKLQVDNELLGGLSTEQGFYLYGEVNISDLRRAVTVGLNRLVNGEWDLALHPRCGTNASVAMLLTFGLALGVNLLLPLRPIEQLIGLGLAATTAAELAPDLGYIAQRYFTTAIPFNLAIESITVNPDPWGRQGHFVKVTWQD